MCRRSFSAMGWAKALVDGAYTQHNSALADPRDDFHIYRNQSEPRLSITLGLCQSFLGSGEHVAHLKGLILGFPPHRILENSS